MFTPTALPYPGLKNALSFIYSKIISL